MRKAIIQGSSKIFHELEPGLCLMTFKDAIHGAQREDQIAGTGDLRKDFTYHFYRLLEKNGIPTHLAGEPRTDGILVSTCQPVKLEILVRNVARGHWVDSHKIPLFEGGTRFDKAIVEFCLKWKTQLEDGRLIDDPRINAAVALALHTHAKDPSIRGRLLTSEWEALQLENMALAINKVYTEFLAEQGWILEDFKFEVGLPNPQTREFVLIDEISPDSSRIRDLQGNSLSKDLFRQRRPQQEITEGYRRLAEAVARKESLCPC